MTFDIGPIRVVVYSADSGSLARFMLYRAQSGSDRSMLVASGIDDGVSSCVERARRLAAAFEPRA